MEKQKEKNVTIAIGLEKQLWLMADKLRTHMDGTIYKHVVLGLIFLKYVSESFVDCFNKLKNEGDGFEDEKDAYLEKIRNLLFPKLISGEIYLKGANV